MVTLALIPSPSVALAVLDSTGRNAEQPVYVLRNLTVWPRLDLPALIGAIERFLQHEKAIDPDIIVDITGVGSPLADQLRVVGINPVGCIISDNPRDRVMEDTGDWAVSKKSLKTGSALLAASGRLKAPKQYLATIDRLGSEDTDCVALALAIWWGMRRNGDNFGDPAPVKLSPWEEAMQRRIEGNEEAMAEYGTDFEEEFDAHDLLS